MKKIFTILFSFFSLFSFAQGHEKLRLDYFRMPENISAEDYLPQTIIIKLKPEFASKAKSRSVDIPALTKELEGIGAISMAKRFQHVTAPTKRMNEKGEQMVDLSLIYEIVMDNSISLEKAINRLYRSDAIEYAEPFYLPQTCFTPNDTSIGHQYALGMMKVFDAWGISQGDTNIVIGIVDTGVDFGHLDLVNNIKYNYNDPINGVDDDGDGFIDNFHGWDLGENNNDPQVKPGSTHGIHVSGIAAASTNNTTGIAGVGFKCKFLPIKITNAAGALTRAYDGIIYAADQGCQVINCSWGSIAGGQFGQDVVNYAAVNKGALVVAAAGNNDSEVDFFPAAYKNTLAVAATGNNDIRWGASNFGYYVDVCAPGISIYSTVGDNNYEFLSGTSMSAPYAAGAAALVKSHFPHYSAMQVAEQLKVTADNVNAKHSNLMEGKLGFGRINLF
ncbi:MAG: S8 family serine peptidase, partial [Bacteroidetes bacterium]|nr:S8 family serine peptidase [Bacteroidota bacterium]